MKQYFLPGLVLALITSCSTENNQEKDQKTNRTTTSVVEVKTVTAKISPFEYIIHSTGKIQSQTDIQLQFKAAGIIQSITARNGQNVAKGSILAELENRTQLLTLKKAEILLKEKQIAYDDQIMSYSSDDDTAVFKMARGNIRYTSGLASAEVSFQEAKLGLENTIIRALTSGTVSDLDLRVGSPVKADQLFCRLHDPLTLLLECQVIESDALRLMGQNSVEIKASTGKTTSGVLIEINPRVDSKTNLVTVLVKLARNHNLLPGMNAQVTFRIPYQENIIVPKEAVLIRAGKHVVFTAEDGYAKWNFVKVGQENGEDVEILEGLKENQSIIISNNLQLAHDTPIRVSVGS
jgi:membrane fusion protein (multidrug efflux system)